MITLTAEERQRFSEWAQQEAESYKLLVQQMSSMPATTPLVATYKGRIAALLFVASHLSAVEVQTLHPVGKAKNE